MPTTGTPVRSANAISDRVPYAPPTAITASADAHHERVAHLPHARGQRHRHVLVRVGPVGPGQDAEHRAACACRAARHRLHHATQPAAHDDRARVREQPTHLLGPCDLVGRGLTRPDHRHVPLAAHRLTLRAVKSVILGR